MRTLSIGWTINYYNKKVQDDVKRLPVDIYADYLRLTGLMIEFGIDLRMPHSKAMGSGLFELRCKGSEGIGRVFYCAIAGKQIAILHSFVKKTDKTPPKELNIAKRRLKEVKNEQ